MSKYLALAAVFIGIFFSSAILADSPAGFWQNPVINGAGKMHPLPDSAFQPQKDVIYKAVFSLTKGELNKDKKQAANINDGLEALARAVNLFASAGVSPDHLKFVAIIHGGATPIVLDNTHYKQEFGVDNPNLELIKQLEAQGVQIAVCGQAVAGWNFEYSWVNPDVKIALSAISTIIILQQRGYALMPE
ncbi:MAG: DsrE family protein [Gammaproteobacteria bacterium]|nr:DsrE family protein [Gammaproteobacteria bacterium]